MLELPSCSVVVATGAGWSVARRSSDTGLAFVLWHTGPDGWDRRITVAEDAKVAEHWSREAWLAWVTASARELVEDPLATVSEPGEVPAPRLGARAAQAWVHVTEREERAGLLVKRSADVAAARFGGADDRACWVRLEAQGRGGPGRDQFEGEWRALLDGARVRLRDGGGARVAAKQADEYPKQLHQELTRRSLTLPSSSVGWGFWGERRVAASGSTGGWYAGLGLTDRLELDLPGYLRWSFGESEALTSPEWAIGGGWTSFDHDATRGSVWGFGAGIDARMRFRAALAWHASAFIQVSHESRSRRDRFGHATAAGLVWDARRWLSFGLEVGEASHDQATIARDSVWIGGLSMPLAVIHLPPLDLGLTGGAAWDGRRSFLVAGFRLQLIL